VSPYVDDYTYVLALLPLVVAGTRLGPPAAMAGSEAGRTARRGRAAVAGWLVLALAALLLGAAIPFREAEPHGLEALLWYPRVFGTLLLWGLLTALAFTRPAAAPAERFA
jgi:hypothetical protein